MNAIVNSAGLYEMSKADKYRMLFNRVEPLKGWDFSRVGVTSVGEKWDFYEEVLKHCKKSDLLLDIGSGGGEKVLQLAKSVSFIAGIDESRDMIKAANENLGKSQFRNVVFFLMNARQMAFRDGLFNIATTRHSAFFAGETARVLADGGAFMTQQVSEADKFNIKKAFGRGQNFGIEDGTSREKSIRQLEDTHFADIKSFEYDAQEFYHTPEDLIFLLCHTPIIPDFGCQAEDFELLAQFIEENKSATGIRTNSRRYMIIAHKI